MRVEDLDTPVLIVDLDALEENLDRYQAYFDQHRIAFRPHIKTHKCLAIARMQMDRGAMGLTCQKIGEAEAMASGGLETDILIPFNIVGSEKLERLTALTRRVPRLTVTADSEETVRGIADAARSDGVTVGVLVEVETGLKRTGVPTPQKAVELARRIHELPGLELRGVM